MKYICRIFELLFLFLLFANLSFAQWTKTNGPGGGTINALATDGANYYTSIDGHGVFISSDDGVSWKAINAGLSRLNVLSIAAKGSMVFAGTDSSGVFLSTNNGNNWVSVNSGLGNLCINVLAMKDTTVFAGTNVGVFISTNNGNTWVADTSGLSGKAIIAFLVKDTLLFAGTNGNGVYKSSKYDSRWKLIGLEGSSITSIAANDSNLFVASFSGVYKSINAGSTWTSLPYPSPSAARTLALIGKNILVAPFYSGGGGIYISRDGGNTWDNTPKEGLGYTNIRALLINNSAILAGGYGGLFKSSDNGNSWSFIEKGIPFSIVTSVTVKDSILFAGIMSPAFNDYSGGGVSFSIDNGDTWTPCNSGLKGLAIISINTIGSNIFTGTSWGSYYTTDNGLTWLPAHSSSTLEMESIVAKGSNLFMVSRGYVYISVNNGSDWTSVSAGLPQYYNSQSKSYYSYKISSLAVIDTILFAGSIGDGVYSSADNGIHWSKTNSSSLFSTVYSLTNKGTNIYAGTYTGIYRSTNNGVNWTSAGLTNRTINEFVIHDQNIFAQTNGGIYLSSNDGGTWTDVSDGLNNKNISNLAIGKRFLYTGTAGDGVWRRPLSEVLRPLISISSSDKSFGNVLLGKFKQDSIFIKNIGSAVLKIDSVKCNAQDFTISPIGKTTINQFDSLKFIISFSPRAVGTRNGSFSFYDNTSSSPNTFSVTGIGNAPTSLFSHTMVSSGTVLIGSNKRDSIYVKNNGTATLQIDSVKTGTTEFNVTPSHDITINPSDSMKFYIVFSPIVIGAKKDSVSFFDNAADSPQKVHLSGNGVLTGVEMSDENIPKVFSLSNNYPNPFNPSTTISFGIPVRSFTTLFIYDIVGREVAVIVSKELSAGSYSFRWNASNIPSGIYFYRLQAGSFTETKKLVLLR